MWASLRNGMGVAYLWHDGEGVAAPVSSPDVARWVVACAADQGMEEAKAWLKAEHDALSARLRLARRRLRWLRAGEGIGVTAPKLARMLAEEATILADAVQALSRIGQAAPEAAWLDAVRLLYETRWSAPRRPFCSWIVGVDPGVQTGLALMVDGTLVWTGVAKGAGDVHTTVACLLDDAKEARAHPIVALERFGTPQPVTTTIRQGLWAEGAARAAAEQRGVAIEEHSPSAIAYLVQKGAARLKERLGVRFLSPHEADAAAHALVCYDGLSHGSKKEGEERR